MKGIIDVTVRLIRAGRRAYARKWSFCWLFAAIFLGSVAVLARLDLLPEAPDIPIVALIANQPDAMAASALAPIVSELPTTIEIPDISLAAVIVNPTTTDIPSLDEKLLKGVVRYPTSAKLGEDGNVVLFGHSSYLPVVKNQAYKTFNGIQKLAMGDVVTVYSSATAYTYRVRSVVEEKADDNTAIPLSVAGKVLTLVTCNSFGQKTARFVVVADFVESHPAGS